MLKSDSASVMAFGAALLAVFLSSSIDAIVKFVGLQTGLFLLLAWRFFFGAIIAFFAYRIRSRQKIRPSSIRFHAARGVIQLVSVSLYFYSVMELSLALATILSFTSGILVAPVASFLLGEKIKYSAAAAAIVGFLGVAITVTDVSALSSEFLTVSARGVGAGIASGLLTAFLLVFLRLRSVSEDPYVISLFTNVVPAVILAPILLSSLARVTSLELLVFLILGCMGYSVWFLLSVAYARLPAQRIAPLDYIGVLFAAAYGYLFFSEPLEAKTFLGGVLIFGASYVAMRSQRRQFVHD